MKILNPNTEEEFVCILKQSVYVRIKDFGQKCFLKEIKVGPAQHSWEWIPFKTNKCLDISGIDNKYCTFDHAINRSVNDPYCTVYEFSDFDDLCDFRGQVVYIDKIKTVYKADDGEDALS